jgi:DNA glycosylase AlkZ-like
MNVSEILKLRLINQQIYRTSFQRPHDLVAWLGAIQAQDYASAQWSIGLRSPQSTSSDVEQAINDGAIIRTWTLRGTLHFVAAEDVRWMLKLMAPRIIAKSVGVYRQARLTDNDFERAFALLEKALQGTKQLTRSKIVELWENAGITTSNQRGYLILARAGQEGRICMGPMNAGQQTFVLLNEWIPAAKELTYEEALVEIAKRYFASHGPATIDDFVWWTGLTRTDAKSAIGMIASQLSRINVDEKEYLYSLAHLQRMRAPGIFLLPGFDEYMLGYTDRSLIIEDIHRHHIYTKNAVYPGIIIVEGRIKGIWKRVLKRQKIYIELWPFATFDTKQKVEISRACEAYGRFWNAPVMLEGYGM